MPVNNEALKDPYFTVYDDTDVITQARYISAKQLNNLQKQVRFKYNHKEIITLLNTTVQQVLLGNDKTDKILKNTAENWKRLDTK